MDLGRFEWPKLCSNGPNYTPSIKCFNGSIEFGSSATRSTERRPIRFGPLTVDPITFGPLTFRPFISTHSSRPTHFAPLPFVSFPLQHHSNVGQDIIISNLSRWAVMRNFIFHQSLTARRGKMLFDHKLKWIQSQRFWVFHATVTGISPDFTVTGDIAIMNVFLF